MSQNSRIFNEVQQLINNYFGEQIAKVTFQATPQGNIPFWIIKKNKDLEIIDVKLRGLTDELGAYNLIPIIKELPSSMKQRQETSFGYYGSQTGQTSASTDFMPEFIDDSYFWLLVAPFKKKGKSDIYLPLALFLATFLSVLFVGILQAINLAEELLSIIARNENLKTIHLETDLQITSLPFVFEPLPSAILYTFGLLSIVSIHELGHMIASRYHKIDASLPYFIPMPLNGLGTFGALISQKEPIKSKNALFDIGLSGPVFGLVIAFIVTIAGLLLSVPVPKELLGNSESGGLFFTFILFELLKNIVFSGLASDSVILIHPLAFAGWIGLLITGLNLMPIGQLDGGHIFRSFLNNNQHRGITYLTAITIIMLNPDLLFMVFLILILYSQYGHPGAQNDVTPLSLKRKSVILLIFVLIILTFPLPQNFF